MSAVSVQRGTIVKIVHVGTHSGNPPGHGGDAPATGGGYGLVRGQNGREAFFVDTDVEGIPFCELRIGELVAFRMEPAALARATGVTRWATDHRVRTAANERL